MGCEPELCLSVCSEGGVHVCAKPWGPEPACGRNRGHGSLGRAAAQFPSCLFPRGRGVRGTDVGGRAGLPRGLSEQGSDEGSSAAGTAATVARPGSSGMGQRSPRPGAARRWQGACGAVISPTTPTPHSGPTFGVWEELLPHPQSWLCPDPPPYCIPCGFFPF